MTQVKLDWKFIFHVFISFTITSLIVTGILVYNISKTTPDMVNLTEINFNDTCFGFVWSKFNLSNIVKYKVTITNMKVPTMPAITTDIAGVDFEFSQCNLNVSTPYLVKLTAFGQKSHAVETATGIMWTTHQVPSPPHPPQVVSITETTITLTLPVVTLTDGPLTAIEVRIKSGEERNLVAEETQLSSSLDPFSGRHKRNSENVRPTGILVRTVEIPHSMLDSFNQRKHTENSHDVFGGSLSTDSLTIKIDLGLEKAGDVYIRSSEDKEDKKSGRMKDAQMQVGSQDRGTTQNMSDQDKHSRIKKRRAGIRRIVMMKATERDKLPILAQAENKHGHDTVVMFLPDSSTAIINTQNRSAKLQSQEGNTYRGDTIRSKTEISDQSQVVQPFAHHYYMSESGRRVQFLHKNGSDIIWLETGMSPNLQIVYDMSRSKVMRNLFQPAPPKDDLLLLQQLMKNTEEILQSDITANDDSSLDVLHLFSVTSDKQAMGDLNVTCHPCTDVMDIMRDIAEAVPSSHLLPTIMSRMLSDVTSKLGMIVKELLDKTSNQIVPDIVRKQMRGFTRRRRSLLGLARRHYQKQLDPETVREIEDRLEVDPYQTRQVLLSATGQPMLVKTGTYPQTEWYFEVCSCLKLRSTHCSQKRYGYFITDHYGVRQPYFNNTKLERCLRRFARYQEARDFVLYGQSLLNLTNLKGLDVSLMYNRLNKIIEINKGRRYKLFLDMFEDFLFWNQDRVIRRIGGDEVPYAAKLGLPPGFPVARIMGGQTRNLTLGDDSINNGLLNPALEPGKEYEVVIAVLSTVADVTKHSWTSVNVTTLPEDSERVYPPFIVPTGAVGAACFFVLILVRLVKKCNRQRKPMPPDDDFRLQKLAERQSRHELSPACTSYCVPASYRHSHSPTTSE